jgi:hypothetical protein
MIDRPHYLLKRASLSDAAFRQDDPRFRPVRDRQ